METIFLTSRRILSCIALSALGAGMSPLLSQATPPAADSGSSGTLSSDYRSAAGRLLGASLVDQEGWQKLTHLTTVIGHRLSGSQGLDRAIDWAYETMSAEGLDGVRKQPVQVPHWVRGEESLDIVSPTPRSLKLLGLGGTVGTPEQGITAPVIVVHDYDELEALPRSSVEGKIVVYAVEWQGYGRTVQYRGGGASRAAKKGAVAVLVRSATGSSLATPHTGALRYDETAPQIPAAAITVEDAEWFSRMAALGHDVEVHLALGARTLPDAPSANVIAEIRGSEKPEEVVVISCHYDSWDVGQGAHDDGASCIAAWQALRIVQQSGMRPRRTLRAVLFTNEENGLAGATAYRAALSDEEVANHVAAIEMDGGNERPIGMGFGPFVMPGSQAPDASAETQASMALLRDIGSLLSAIEADQVTAGGGGADIGPLMKDGVPGMALRTVGEHYFDWHHTEADTLDKIEPRNFQRAVALFAIYGYVLADMPGTL